MKNIRLLAWMVSVALGTLAGATAMAGDTAMPQQTPFPTSIASYGNSGQSSNVYDLAPAYGRAAYFDEQYQRTYADLQMVIERQRKQYLLSDEYRAASKKVADTKAAYDAAREPVLQALIATQEYRDLIEKRTRVSIALQQEKLPMVDVAALAHRKMEYGAAASRMEADALNADATVRQTRADYLAAQADLNDKLAKSDAGLYQQPEFVEAKKAFDFARENRAGAQGVLAGAWISRCDTLEGDRRRYPGPTNSTVAPWIDSGFWTGYYGGTGVVRPF